MMRRMGIEAIYRRPQTSKPADGHKIYPYLLRGCGSCGQPSLGQRHHLHADDARLRLSNGDDGLVQPVRAGLAGVINMEVAFCLDALEEALARHGRPEIFNTDQGSQFTSAAFTGLLRQRDRDQHGRPRRGSTTCSSNGCGARSNTKRSTCAPMTASARHGARSDGIWTSIMAGGGIRALARRTPDQAYFNNRPLAMAASTSPPIWGVAPVGLRPPCLTPPNGNQETTGRKSIIVAERCSDQAAHLYASSYG